MRYIDNASKPLWCPAFRVFLVTFCHFLYAIYSLFGTTIRDLRGRIQPCPEVSDSLIKLFVDSFEKCGGVHNANSAKLLQVSEVMVAGDNEIGLAFESAD